MLLAILLCGCSNLTASDSDDDSSSSSVSTSSSSGKAAASIFIPNYSVLAVSSSSSARAIAPQTATVRLGYRTSSSADFTYDEANSLSLSDGTSTDSTNSSGVAGATYNFTFTLPAATYSAGNIIIEMLDSSNNVLSSGITSSEYTISSGSETTASLSMIPSASSSNKSGSLSAGEMKFVSASLTSGTDSSITITGDVSVFVFDSDGKLINTTEIPAPLIFTENVSTFSPSETGTYYFGIYSASAVESYGFSITGTDDVSVTSIEFSSASKTLVVGDSIDLTDLITISPKDATDMSITWTVSGDGATVDDGIVTVSELGDYVVTATANGGENVAATFTVTGVAASAQEYNFIALNSTAGDSVSSVASTDSNASLTCTNVIFQNSNYGIKYNSGSIVIPTTGADTTIIAYVTYTSGTSLILSDGDSYSVTRTIANRGTRASSENIDFKENAGPQAYVWRYTGGKTSVTLSASGQVYVGKLFVDNDFISDTQTTSKFDFTSANDSGLNEIPTNSSGSSQKIYFFSSGTQSDTNHATIFYSSQYGMK